MRCSLLLLLCACEEATQRVGPAVARKEPPLPPMSLTQAGELHVMLVDERGTPHCERWLNDPSARALAVDLGSVEVKLGYEVVDADIRLTIPHPTSPKLACQWRVRAVPAGDALVVKRVPESLTGPVEQLVEREGGARWFRTAEHCASAIERGEKVATLLPCQLSRRTSPVTPAEAKASSKQRFESLLQRGGTMFNFGESDLRGCTAVSIKPRRIRSTIEGSFALRYRQIYDDGTDEHGVVRYEYTWKLGSDEMHVSGPERTPDGRPDEGYARMCGSTTTFEWRATGVETLEPGLLYFTEADCGEALASYDARARWYAAKEPATGGCGM